MALCECGLPVAHRIEVFCAPAEANQLVNPAHSAFLDLCAACWVDEQYNRDLLSYRDACRIAAAIRARWQNGRLAVPMRPTLHRLAAANLQQMPTRATLSRLSAPERCAVMRYLVDEAGMTPRAIAERLGVTPRSVQRWARTQATG